MEFKENKTEPVNEDQLVIDKINKIFEKLQVTVRQKRLGEKIEGCESLKGKRIIQVDDSVDILKGLVADLTMVTDDNASFLLHKDQSEEELAQEILKSNPNIVLMDKTLANKINGINVVKNLLSQNPNLICIGFSSESNSSGDFIGAGAIGFVEKRTHDPETIRKIADLVSKK